ncbi:MAG: ABC transporter permease [Saccharofermentanales bacterium]
MSDKYDFLPNDWEPLQRTAGESEKIVAKNRTFLGDVIYRFTRKTSAMIGMILIVLLCLFAFIGPFLTPYNFDTQSLEFANLPPRMKVAEVNGKLYYLSPSLKVIAVDSDGVVGSSLKKTSEDGIQKKMVFADGEQEIIVNYKMKPAAIVLSEDHNKTAETQNIWNNKYVLGTDGLGRDMLTRLMFGTRISLIVAFIATIVNMTIGMIYGGISAYAGGLTDIIMMRIVDIISTIPLTLYVILIMVIMENGFLSIIVALSSVYWVSMARVVRGQIVVLKNSEFVLAAITVGSGSRTILFRHLLPNAMGPILVTATMLVPSAIFMEAFLGFIGLGIAPPMASLGTMANDALQGLRTSPYQLFLPAAVICLIMFAFNFVGDGLRDALDPKMKK